MTQSTNPMHSKKVLTCPRVFSFFKLRRMAPSAYPINSKKALTCLSRASFFKFNRMTLSTECPAKVFSF